MSELKVDKVSPRSGNYVALNTVGSKNIIINGDMSIAQRGTSETGITSGGYYTVDRWKLQIGTAGTWTQSQSTDVPTGQGFTSSLKMDCTVADAAPAAGDYLIIDQRIEGQNLQYLKKGTANAESVTLSFWVKSNKTGTYILELYDNDNSRQISKSYTIDSASTWEKKTITIDGDTSGAFDNDNNLSLLVNFWLVAGSNFTSGTLNTSWNSPTTANRAVGQVNLADNTANEFYITGIQLEAGTTASDFEFLPFDVNLGRCERYYQVVADGSQAINAAITTAAIWTSSAAYSGYTFKKTMRSSPSLDIVTGTDFYRIRSANNNYNSNTLSIGNVTNYTARLNIQSTGMTPGYSGWIAIYDQATGFVALDAEL
jgi:hypothetical protein